MTYQITVFENPAEFLDAKAAAQLPDGVGIVFDGDVVRLDGEESKRFTLANDIKQSDLVTELFKRQGFKVRFT